MRKLSQLGYRLLIIGILLVIARSTKADSLTVTNGQTVQLGLPGISTNYSYTAVTVDTNGTLKISGSVGLIVTSNVLINGQITGGSKTQAASGADGDDGTNGVLVGDVAEDGGAGGDANNGTNGVADSPYLSIFAKNMTVNGSILLNPEGDASDGGDGGAAGNGADGLAGFFAGDGGPGGVGGYGGNAASPAFLTISLGSGTFILGTNGQISLDNMGTGGGGGAGGDGGVGGKGGDSTGGGGNGGIGGDGGPSGYGGSGGVGGAGGTISISAARIDLEGTISSKGNDGGDGGDLGAPEDGGNGGNGSPDPSGGTGGRGGNGGNAGDAFLEQNPGGVGGNGGFGGNLILTVTTAFTNFAKMDFSGGSGGQGGSGQAGGTATGGTGGAGAGGGASGQDGQPSADVPDAQQGTDGPAGSMTVNNISWGTNSPDGWQTFGDGVLIYGVTNNIHTVTLSSTNGPFSIIGQLPDPRLQYDTNTYDYVVETNEPMQFQFAYQWLTTIGSINVMFSNTVVLTLHAPSVLASGFTTASVALTKLPAQPSDQLTLTFQLTTTSGQLAEFELGTLSLQVVPQTFSISIAPALGNPTQLNLTWFGATNENYQLQYNTSLNGGAWLNQGPVIPGQETTSTVSLPVTPGETAEFYRLVMTPAN